MKSVSDVLLVKEPEFQFVLKLFPPFVDTVKKKRYGNSTNGI